MDGFGRRWSEFLEQFGFDGDWMECGLDKG